MEPQIATDGNECSLKFEVRGFEDTALAFILKPQMSNFKLQPLIRPLPVQGASGSEGNSLNLYSSVVPSLPLL
jgi:hypothetical protein